MRPPVSDSIQPAIASGSASAVLWDSRVRADDLPDPIDRCEELMDRLYTLAEINDRFAIADLYDRQLAAAEAWDFDAYDTTFAPDAEIDLSDFGVPPQRYPAYRAWLATLQQSMPQAQRISGGLRLVLDGDAATTRVPVVCYVTLLVEGLPRATTTGLFYEDRLRRTADGWRIVARRETLAWRGA